MPTTPAARIGESFAAIETPALIVDLDSLDSNLRKMADLAARAGVRLRPHAKTHRCSAIARAQIALGAVGVCCQTVGEAEAMVNGGVADVLVSNEIVGPRKLDRLAALALRARVAVCVDHPDSIAVIEAAAARFGAKIAVLVEIDVGAARCGVAPGAPAAQLARRVAASPHLTFAGLQAYHGRAQHLRAFQERQSEIAAAGEKVRVTLDALAREGLSCDIVGGAGTGTFALEAASGVWNELQVGSYVFMDADYAANRAVDGGAARDFAHALFVKASVISLPGDQRAIVDAGLKSMAAESGLPTVHGLAAKATRMSDEHTTLVFESAPPALGEPVRLIPGHCDPTVNLHDWIICVRNDRVETIWPVDARGAAG